MEELKIYGEQLPPLYDVEIGQPVPTITPYFLEDTTDTACILICAGGAYMRRSEHEAGAVAEFFNECGFHAAVLNYRLMPYHYPAALLDAQRAIRFLRHHACRGIWYCTEQNCDIGFFCGRTFGGIECIA